MSETTFSTPSFILLPPPLIPLPPKKRRATAITGEDEPAHLKPGDWVGRYGRHFQWTDRHRVRSELDGWRLEGDDDADALLEVVGSGSATDVVQLLLAIAGAQEGGLKQQQDGSERLAGNGENGGNRSSGNTLRHRSRGHSAASATLNGVIDDSDRNSDADADLSKGEDAGVAALTPEQKAACLNFVDKYVTTTNYIYPPPHPHLFI